jgi:hypothetical protein
MSPGTENGPSLTPYERTRRRLAWTGDQVFVLATAALVLSVLLRGWLVPPARQQLWLLSLCWIALTLCIVGHLIVLYLEAGLLLDAERHPGAPLTRRQQATTTLLPILVHFCFAVAMLALTVFAVANNTGPGL